MKPAVTLLSAALLVCSACRSSPEPVTRTAEPPASRSGKILFFYPSSAVVARGEQVLLCFGVEEVKSVRLEPPVEEIKPAFNRCVPDEPKASTEYRLIAVGNDGKQTRQSVSVKVEGVKRTSVAGQGETSAGLIRTFLPTASQVSANQEVTLCYDVGGGVETIMVEPAVNPAPAPPKGCFTVRPSQTTTYTLKAQGSGKSEAKKITINVR